MNIQKMFVATQKGAMGNELVAYGHDRNKVIAELHQQLMDETANAYAHEAAMGHLSDVNSSAGAYGEDLG